jgi:hypothetical protein
VLSLSKEIDFKTKVEFKILGSLSIHIQMTWNFFHMYSPLWSIKNPKLQIQKCSNKGDMSRKLDLTQSFQKLITFTKHIFLFSNFENRSILWSSMISPSFILRSFHNRSRCRF